MRVLTLSPEDFSRRCHELAEMVFRGCPQGFEAAVGIRRGGAFVAAEMLKDFPKGYIGEYYEVCLQRPTTRQKDASTLIRLLPRLPLWTLNLLRMAEAVWLTRLRRLKPQDCAASVELPDDLGKSCRRILLIDDAADTGATLLQVVRSLRGACPEAEIVTAVITSTAPHPLIVPDFALWRNGTLVRFPWAKDYREKQA